MIFLDGKQPDDNTAYHVQSGYTPLRRVCQTVGSNGNGRHYQDQTDRKNEQTMTQDKDLIFAQHTFFCFSATAQVAHLVLPDTQRQRFAKPKEPLFSNALNTAFQNFTNFATK